MQRDVEDEARVDVERRAAPRETAIEHFRNGRQVLWGLRDQLLALDRNVSPEARRVIVNDLNAADARIAAGLAELAQGNVAPAEYGVAPAADGLHKERGYQGPAAPLHV